MADYTDMDKDYEIVNESQDFWGLGWDGLY